MKLYDLLLRLAKSQQAASELAETFEYFLSDTFPKVLMQKETLQCALGVTQAEMEEIYEEGYFLYQQEAFGDASVAFRWLVLFNPLVGKYWMGLGASLQLLEKYERALHAYAALALLECENPHAHFYAYECYVALDQKEEAIKALRLSYDRTRDRALYADLQKEIEYVLRTLSPSRPSSRFS